MNPFTFSVLSNIIGSFFSSVGFAVLFNVPRNALVAGGIIGSLGWMGYFTLHTYNGSVFLASVLCAFILAVCSRWAAKIFKQPTQVFFVPGLIPVVPGVTIFQAIQALILGEYRQAGLIFLDVVYICIGIACALGLSSAFHSIHKALKNSGKSSLPNAK